MHDFMKLYTGPPKFEFGRVEFASGGPGGPPVSKVNVEPWTRPVLLSLTVEGKASLPNIMYKASRLSSADNRQPLKTSLAGRHWNAASGRLWLFIDIIVLIIDKRAPFCSVN